MDEINAIIAEIQQVAQNTPITTTENKILQIMLRLAWEMKKTKS